MLDQTDFDVDLETEVLEVVFNWHHDWRASCHLLGYHLLCDAFVSVSDL